MNNIYKEKYLNYKNKYISAKNNILQLGGAAVEPEVPRIQFDNNTLRTAVELWLNDNEEAMSRYGHISEWDVSNVTYMGNMFRDARNFNQDISRWNVSNVTSMIYMFNGATNFNNGGSPSISRWNVSNVTDMEDMFNGATNFNQDISRWNVSNVQDMEDMFYGATAFNTTYPDSVDDPMSVFQPQQPTVAAVEPVVPRIQFDNESLRTAVRLWLSNNEDAMNQYGHISEWDVSRVTDMDYMFYDATNFNEDISNWNVSRVTDMGNMFYGARNFNQDISRWNVSNVTDMRRMFNDARRFNQDISSWNVSNVTDMEDMFCDARNFNQDISSWNVSRVTDMGNMFYGARNFNQDISRWNVSNVTDMLAMFYLATAFNTTYPNSIDDPMSVFQPQQPTVAAVEPEVPRIQFDNESLRTAVALWFVNDEETTSQYGHISEWDVSRVTRMGWLFERKNEFNQDISRWNVSNVIDMQSMFLGAINFNQDISRWNVSNVTNMSNMFNNAINFNRDIGGWNVSNVTNMAGMFRDATDFNKDISRWNVSSVTDMEDMFMGATYFNEDISRWNVSNVTNMSNMFNNAINFNRDIGGWNVSNVTNMSTMFNAATYFNQDISRWDVSLVTNMAYMFNAATSFNNGGSPSISRWNVSNVTNMTGMFRRAINFNQDISRWNVSSVTDMEDMFDDANAFNRSYPVSVEDPRSVFRPQPPTGPSAEQVERLQPSTGPDAEQEEQTFVIDETQFIEEFRSQLGIRGTTRVNIDREAIFDSIKVYGDSFFSTQLKVEFTGERGQDCNGLRREFFTLLSKDFIEKRLLKEEESTYFVIDNNGDDINELPNYHFMGQLFAYAIKSGNLINVRLHPIILYSLLNSTYGERKYNILETDGHKLFEFFDTISKEDTKLILEHISLELKYSDRNINGISTIEEILEKIRSYDDDILQTAPYSDYLRKRILTDEEWRELTKQEKSICLQDISCDSVQFSRKSNTEDLQRKLKQARDHMIKTREVRSEIQKTVDQAKVQTDEMKKIMDDAITKSKQAIAAFQTIQREINRNQSMQAEETGDEGYKIVAYEKREQFIEFKIKSYLFNQFRGEYEEFVRGFHSIIPLELLQRTNISPKSLDLMIAGKRTIDLDEFLANLQISGASEEKKELIMEIIREGVSEHNDYLNKLLFFITAKENLSYLGYGDFSQDPLRLNFTNIEASMPHTCFNYADIPQSYLEDDINTDESGNTWTLTSREKLAKELSYQQLLSEKDMTFNRAGGGNKIVKLFL